ncbi:MAG: hypothetical protein ACE5JU_01805 [Candidatus Binatia bacterium]
MPNFDEWFKRATGNDPYLFRGRRACPERGRRGRVRDIWSMCRPGLGKGAMALDVQSTVLR